MFTLPFVITPIKACSAENRKHSQENLNFFTCATFLLLSLFNHPQWPPVMATSSNVNKQQIKNILWLHTARVVSFQSGWTWNGDVNTVFSTKISTSPRAHVDLALLVPLELAILARAHIDVALSGLGLWALFLRISHEWWRGLENVTAASIVLGVTSKWVKFPFLVSHYFNLLLPWFFFFNLNGT